ncbi:MAG: hypothetical protein OXI77_08095 [Chloroflexota bacterium]|nr:hypothetical protein [Chloroflexota bacterium]MDE2908208.1 hypothetical protein [Chloroflexota bacterium]
MKFKPFDRMWDHIETQKDQSDAAYFNALMYMGEMLTKFTVAAMVSAVNDGRERHQYQLRHPLVRADGIGTWSQILDRVLTGVPAQHLIEDIKGEGKEVYELTKRTKADAWQHISVSLLYNSLRIADPNAEPPPTRIQAKSWFNLFSALRNRTRGHGAISGGKASAICADLKESIETYLDNFCLFQRPWAYMAQTQKRKYHVVRWTDDSGALDILKRREGTAYSFAEGAHILFGERISQDTLRSVHLISSDIDSTDYFLPNGGWDGKRFELLSYMTGSTKHKDANNYLAPVTELPPSETEARASVTEQGETILNVPPKQRGYIPRQAPEESLYREIVDDNQHRIVTLFGRGGIGKTWLTIEVLDRIAQEADFTAILWFSARDIDLLPDGAQQVKPQVLTEKDIAREFTKHIGPWLLSAEALSEVDPVNFLRQNMYNSDFGKILFVFDNFETVNSPIDLFNWIDHYLRLPNKAVITTRFREFRGDYPVELAGMSYEECSQLIDATSRRLSITHLISNNDKDKLFDASDGHPYVVKILLGEIRKFGRATKLERYLANQENLLDTLFERTYTRLPMAAQRVFLTLCGWKSLVAETAIQAVLLRPGNEITDVTEAIDDLHNSSLIERNKSESDSELYWSVPLAARLFGLKKLETNRKQLQIRDDIEFLRLFGASQESDVKQGMQPRIKRLFGAIESKVDDVSSVEDFAPIIESVARQYPDTWLLLADLYKRLGSESQFESTLERYIESSDTADEKRTAWEKLARHFQARSKYADELFSRIQLAQLPDTDYETISDAVNRFNNIVRQPEFEFESDEKSQIVQLLILLMEQRADEADATDFSRLGWLYMHNNQLNEAESAARRGLAIDESSEYCDSLLQRVQNNT